MKQVARARSKEPHESASEAALVRPVQLLVEGPDDLHVVCALLGIDRNHCSTDRLQIHIVGGKDKFALPMKAWKAGTQQAEALETTVEKIVILRDNDEPDARGKAVKAFQDAGFPLPAGYGVHPSQGAFTFTTEVLLVPEAPECGEVEDLLLAALAGDSTLSAADAYLRAAGAVAIAARTPPLGSASGDHFVSTAPGSKARVQAYLSQFAQAHYKLLGMAFEHKIVDPSASAFDHLRNCLTQL